MLKYKKIGSIILIFLFTVNFCYAEPATWAKDSFFSLNYEKILSDELKNIEKLQNNITREEFADLIVRLYSKVTRKNIIIFSEINPFNDTDNVMVAKAYNLGIVHGVAKNKFSPEELVTREQIAVMLYNMLNITGNDINSIKNKRFVDENEVSIWAKDAVNFVVNKEILTGVGNNMISPKTYATREQAIVLVNRLMEKFKFIEIINQNSDKMTVNGFIVPNLLESQIMAYTPRDKYIDFRLVSRVDVTEQLNIKKQQLEIIQILDSKEEIDYKEILEIADIINNAYDPFLKRYTLKESIIVYGYYKYKIYGDGNLTIDLIKR